ncbi:MAG: PAS domain-containing protein, partial [Holophagales bacterium]|nr:PAS domain-containing protein [Holophagales bacterium]
FALHRGAFLDPSLRPAQEVWMLFGTLTLGGLAFLQRHRLGVRMRRISNDRRKIERTLASSERRARLAAVRKKAERELFHSREKYAKAFRACPYGLLLCRARDGMQLEWNDRYLELSGYSREEVEGKSTEDLGIWADPADRREMERRLRQHGSMRDFGIDLRRKDGSRRRTLVSAESLEIDGEPYRLFVARDVDDIALEAERRRQWAGCFERARAATVLLDRAGRARDWNAAAQDLFRWPPPPPDEPIDLPLAPVALAEMLERTALDDAVLLEIRDREPRGQPDQSARDWWWSRVRQEGNNRFLAIVLPALERDRGGG